MEYSLFIAIAVYMVPILIRSRNPIGIVGAILIGGIGIVSVIPFVQSLVAFFRHTRRKE